MRIRFVIAALVAAIVSTPAAAESEMQRIITQADRERLENYEATRAEALREARSSGFAHEIAVLDEMVAGKRRSFYGFDLAGEWQCRTAKAGGLAGLVIYPWFACRVSDDGSRYRLEKLGGSQRTTGRFFTDIETRLIYLGTFHVAGETPAPYGSGPQSDQAGYAFRTGADRWRIEFPAPVFESKLDILELRR